MATVTTSPVWSLVTKSSVCVFGTSVLAQLNHAIRPSPLSRRRNKASLGIFLRIDDFPEPEPR
jgi:hypothetical protein